ncbi:hypothetical protein MRBLPE1_005184 [Paenibacillus sp. LPE1-1-1.1]
MGYWNDWTMSFFFIQDKDLYSLQFYLYKIVAGAVLNRGSDVVSLKDEIAQISAYFSIQNKRFNGSLQLVLEPDEELLQFKVLKLILQPLVENAILHGILCKEEREVP